MTERLTFLQQIVKAYQQGGCAGRFADFFGQRGSIETEPMFAVFMTECMAYREHLERLGILQAYLSTKEDPKPVDDQLRPSEDAYTAALLSEISREIGHSVQTGPPEIQIYHNTVLLHRIVFSSKTGLYLCKNILPGTYTIKLLTGRVIWERELMSSEVLLTFSTDQTEVKVAAQTTSGESAPTLEDCVMDRIRIRVFAGPDSGSMEIGYNE
jgi:hypothetical protein